MKLTVSVSLLTSNLLYPTFAHAKSTPSSRNSNTATSESNLITMSPENKFARSMTHLLSKVKNPEELAHKFLSYESQRDQKFILAYLKDNNLTKLPKARVINNTITLSNTNGKITIEILSLADRKFKVNDYEFTIDPSRTAAERFRFFERIANYKKKTVLIYYILPEAHALYFLGVPLYMWAIGVGAVAAGGISQVGANTRENTELAKLQIREGLYNYKIGLSCKGQQNHPPAKNSLFIMNPESNLNLPIKDNGLNNEMDYDLLHSEDYQSEYEEIGLTNPDQLRAFLVKINPNFINKKDSKYVQSDILVEFFNSCCEIVNRQTCLTSFNVNDFGNIIYESPVSARSEYNASHSFQKGNNHSNDTHSSINNSTNNKSETRSQSAQ